MEKGFVDSLPPGPEQQADRGMTLNPDTIHSDLDDIVTLGLQPSQELNVNRSRTLNPNTIHPELDELVDPRVQPSAGVAGGWWRRIEPRDDPFGPR